MAVNQSQVDHIINSASEDDPEAQMQRLKEEVDLIKVSIKKLLIDIRERLNELDNPFVVAPQSSGTQEHSVSVEKTIIHEKDPEQVIAPPQPVAAAPPVQMPAPPTAAPLPPAPPGVYAPYPVAPYGAAPLPGQPAIAEGPINIGDMTDRLSSDEELLLSLSDQLGEMTGRVPTAAPDKLRLHKVHRLFEWTSKMVKKYGHDRLEIMIESYEAMGYVPDDACAQVKEIARLMPQSIGDSHEIGSNEFVSELYVLNRILDPGDKSLDRDMIEVLMDHRQSSGTPRGKKSKEELETPEDWMDMLDGI